MTTSTPAAGKWRTVRMVCNPAGVVGWITHGTVVSSVTNAAAVKLPPDDRGASAGLRSTVQSGESGLIAELCSSGLHGSTGGGNSMVADLVLDAIELELEQAVANVDAANLERGLINLGWERYAPAQDTAVIGSIWRHRDDDRAHAQSGTQGADFYFGVIANFPSDADATACFHRALDRIQPHLTASGFGSDLGDNHENHLWTNDSHAVILSMLLQRTHEPHVLPAAVQFAIQPVTALVNDAERAFIKDT